MKQVSGLSGHPDVGGEEERHRLCLITGAVSERIAVANLKAATAKFKKITMKEHLYDLE